VDLRVVFTLLAGALGLISCFVLIFTDTSAGLFLPISIAEVRELASKMLGHNLITIQTGAAGRPVNKVYICERHYIRREKYLAFMMDRTFNGPVVIASRKGGMDIEVVAHEDPSAILKEPIDINTGMTEEQAIRIATSLGFEDNVSDVRIITVTSF
jgi:succinyl-CoA synthetase beta subunit